MEPLDTTIFKALAVEQRAKIMSLLCDRSLCAGALARKLHLSAGAVSQHLAILKKCGLVIGRKRGYFTHYRVAPDARQLVGQAVDALFCGQSHISETKTCATDCQCPKHTAQKGDIRDERFE